MIKILAFIISIFLLGCVNEKYVKVSVEPIIYTDENDVTHPNLTGATLILNYQHYVLQ
jgi:hypothetical protein